MKKILCILALVAVGLQGEAQTTFTALTIKPSFPKENSRLSFEYNQNFSPLIRLPRVELVVYQFSEKGLKVTEPGLIRKGTILTGSFIIDSNTNCIAFAFSAGEEKDLNKNKGYVIPVYSKPNTPVEGFYRSASFLFRGYGEELFDLPPNHEKELAYLEEGMQQFPRLKNNPQYLDRYFDALLAAKKNDGPALVAAALNQFERQDQLTEEGYFTLSNGYRRIKRKDTADSLTTMMKAKFPNGFSKKNELIDSFYNERDPTKQVAVYKEFTNRYSLDADKQTSESMKSRIAASYGRNKDYEAAAIWSKGLSKETIYYMYNDLAWSMAEKGEDLAQAKVYSAAATKFAKGEMLKPTLARPLDQSAKQWMARRRSAYGMYADTYAFILYKLTEYKAALPYAKEAAAIYEKDAEYNERYALLLEKAAPVKEAQLSIEKMVKAGIASSKTKEVLKNLYVKVRQTDKGFDAYLGALEADAKLKRREEIAKTIIDEAAPPFALKDMDGKLVSLTDLKGKILVVDFWATWCGPCIASMPGMNKALAKFKDNENIHFLFVDTWESAPDKVQNARDFMKKKDYPFHVLMDSEDEMVKDFQVRGIPTKFIIDRSGRIRFKAVGFGGNDDALVDELTTMIEMVSK